jgi:gamma-glutamylcyclotransferase (GGCT)/AIG2-like uncharacterized protein YtfP
MNHRVFVYGTLKQGFPNHKYFLEGKGELVEPYARLENYRLYDTKSGFPCILPHFGGTVMGEIYEIDEKILEVLDALESIPFLYTRELVPALDCWTYVWAGKWSNLTPILDGVWK